ncbi:MAG: twin-arginine translocase subunit TatC [bacterium]|nr:twin-arginine translocase subunit TatC [bacterium]
MVEYREIGQDAPGGDMPFLEHIEELRKRLIKIILSIIGFAIVAYFFSDQLVELVVKPVGTVYFRQPAGAFMLRMKLAGFAGLVMAIPVVLFQFWRFVIPGLYKREVKYLVPVTILGTIFFFGGAGFCFFGVIPNAIKFLQEFGTENVKPLIDVSDYFSFVFWMCVAFGAVFQLPIIAYFLGRIGLITAQTLRRGRRFAVIGILIVAALITPTPDAFSMMLLAVPLYVLYEISVFVVQFTGVRKE